MQKLSAVSHAKWGGGGGGGGGKLGSGGLEAYMEVVVAAVLVSTRDPEARMSARIARTVRVRMIDLIH